MVLHHIQKAYDQFIIGNGDDIVQVLLNIWEDIAARCLDCGTVRNGVDRRKRCYLACGEGCLHAIGTGGFHTYDFNLRIQKLCQC